MFMYRCDKCGKVFDWYETCHHDKKFNHMTYRERENWIKEHPDAPFTETPNNDFAVNCLHARILNPINGNMMTNNGVVTAVLEEANIDNNNELILLCQDCMSDFINSLEYLGR